MATRLDRGFERLLTAGYLWRLLLFLTCIDKGHPSLWNGKNDIGLLISDHHLRGMIKNSFCGGSCQSKRARVFLLGGLSVPPIGRVLGDV